MYAHGEGVPKDDARAIAYYRKGCDGGAAHACTNLGTRYQDGRGVAKDEAQSAVLYRQACVGGDGEGCLYLGIEYEGGNGVGKDLFEAFALYRKAASLGDVRGHTCVGEMYEEGKGVARDLTKAMADAAQTAERETGAAATPSAFFSSTGGAPPRTTPAPPHYYGRACEAKFPTGCNNLAIAYEKGRGVAKDPPRAVGYRQRPTRAATSTGASTSAWCLKRESACARTTAALSGSTARPASTARRAGFGIARIHVRERPGRREGSGPGRAPTTARAATGR